ncbi:MAG: TolC family protein [Fibrobacter sp.]|nr:TolC family protein [Fibrobacter sp.]
MSLLKKVKGSWPRSWPIVLFLVFIDYGVINSEENLLSFGDALKIASSRGLSVLKSQNVVADRENSVRQSKGTFYPSASAGLSAGKSATFPDGYSSPGQGSANLGLNYSLSASSFASHDATKYSLRSAAASLEQTRNSIMLEAAQKFIAVISAQAAIDVQKANLESQTQQLEEISAFYDHGRKAISDVLQQKTAVSEAQSRLLSTQYDFENKKMELFTLLGLPLDTNVQLENSEVWNIAEMFASKDTVITAPKADTITLPQIAAQKNALAATQKNLDAAKRAWWPSLDFSASISDDVRFSGRNSGSDGTANARASVSVSIPIFDKFQRSSKITSTEISLNSAKLALEELERDIELSEKKARLNFSLAQKQTEVVKTQLESARQSLDAIQERYSVGAATLTEVSSVNTQYLNAQLADIDARLQIVSSYINILHENGIISAIVDKDQKLPKEEN